jgi:hypothetical protein
MGRISSKLSYANIVASIALFIALGGLSYAALTLPKNSVGTKQLKTNAVTGAKVKNGTLKEGDFAKGILSSAATAAIKGDKGDPGQDADLGLLDPANYLPGAAVAVINFSGGGTSIPFKAYRIDCPSETSQSCTATIGGAMTPNIEFNAWFELAQQGSPGATQSFSITEYASPGGTMTRRFSITNGRPQAMRTLNERFELTFSTEYVQRIAV